LSGWRGNERQDEESPYRILAATLLGAPGYYAGLLTMKVKLPVRTQDRPQETEPATHGCLRVPVLAVDQGG
jgi:hypothetical protein